MISEFIEDDFSAVNSPSGSLVDVEAELDQSLEGMEVIPDILHADDLADLEQALDDVDEPVGHNPFAVEADGEDGASESFSFVEPQTKKFNSFATVDGHSFQSMTSSGSTDYLVLMRP